MKHELLLSWRHHHFLSTPSPLSLSVKKPTTAILLPVRATLEAAVAEDRTTPLTAKEKRQLRNERRETNNNWKEKVEDRLLEKPKKIYKTWKDELNLDNLAQFGHRWWIVKATRVEETAEVISKAFKKNIPDLEFKVHIPAVQVKKKLKDGSISVKPKFLFKGCIFLNCILNKQVHDLVLECDGVKGFIAVKVGNIKRQIYKPRPVSDDQMEEVFQQAKEEQKLVDQAFKEEHPDEGSLDQDLHLASDKNRGTAKSKRQSTGKLQKPRKGSTVRIVSGTFADFLGTVMKLDNKTKTATVRFTVFGKEILVDLDASEIVAKSN